mgnify:CR=1 FL=1
MAGSITGTWRGIETAKAALRGIPDKLRRRALMNALKAGGRIVQKAARSRAPLLKLTTYSGAQAFRSGRRKVGTVAKAISVRVSKISKREGNVGVFINVRPLKTSTISKFKKATGKAGADNPDDPYYWRWLNFGRKAATRRVKLKTLRRSGGVTRRSQTGAYAGARFLEAGAAKLPEALRQFELSIGPQIRRLNVNPRDPL